MVRGVAQKPWTSTMVSGSSHASDVAGALARVALRAVELDLAARTRLTHKESNYSESGMSTV